MKFLSDIFRVADLCQIDGVHQAWPSSHQSSIPRRLRMPEQPEPNYLDEPETISVGRFIFKIIRIGALLLIWAFFTYILVRNATTPDLTSVVTVLPNETVLRRLSVPHDATQITLKGPIDLQLQKHESVIMETPHVGVNSPCIRLLLCSTSEWLHKYKTSAHCILFSMKHKCICVITQHTQLYLESLVLVCLLGCS